MKKSYSNFIEVGIDEAGRGPLMGRVYVGAVIWDDKLSSDLINDSKKLSKKKRKIAREWIEENALDWAVGWADAEEIDQINILQATRLAITRCLESLSITPKHIIIDGKFWKPFYLNGKRIYHRSIIKGDSQYYSIAAASILAKEYHDDYIKELCEENPELDRKYDWSNNMGYGTKKHLQGIERYGITQYHRKSYKPICNYVENSYII